MVRPFSLSSELSCRCYSLPFQRRITDFGSEKSFDRAAAQTKEHYNVDISASTVRRITEGHGAQIEGHPELIQGAKRTIDDASLLIIETDGSMIPIVEIDSEKEGDQRKHRTVCWKETKLGLSYKIGMSNPVFGVTTGGPDQAGDQLEHCSEVLGGNKNTQIHGVGDGAAWIADQVERKYGENGKYTIDFCHLCEYLSAASKSCAEDHEGWFDQQKKRMKTDKVDQVLAAMELHLEPESVGEQDAPVRKCFRYINNRPGQFRYQEAMEADLPIGSGKIESAHRYVIQERIKLAGAWWKIENADSMLALRTMRANGGWENYWSIAAQQSH